MIDRCQLHTMNNNTLLHIWTYVQISWSLIELGKNSYAFTRSWPYCPGTKTWLFVCTTEILTKHWQDACTSTHANFDSLAVYCTRQNNQPCLVISAITNLYQNLLEETLMTRAPCCIWSFRARTSATGPFTLVDMVESKFSWVHSLIAMPALFTWPNQN